MSAGCGGYQKDNGDKWSTIDYRYKRLTLHYWLQLPYSYTKKYLPVDKDDMYHIQSSSHGTMYFRRAVNQNKLHQDFGTNWHQTQWKWWSLCLYSGTCLKEVLIRMYNRDFTETTFVEWSTENMSEENEKLLKILEDGTKLTCGHYRFPLPFRNVRVELSNNKCQAQQL